MDEWMTDDGERTGGTWRCGDMEMWRYGDMKTWITGGNDVGLE